jgi:hypothetical protein
VNPRELSYSVQWGQSHHRGCVRKVLQKRSLQNVPSQAWASGCGSVMVCSPFRQHKPGIKTPVGQSRRMSSIMQRIQSISCHHLHQCISHMKLFCSTFRPKTIQPNKSIFCEGHAQDAQDAPKFNKAWDFTSLKFPEEQAPKEAGRRFWKPCDFPLFLLLMAEPYLYNALL